MLIERSQMATNIQYKIGTDIHLTDVPQIFTESVRKFCNKNQQARLRVWELHIHSINLLKPQDKSPPITTPTYAT